MALTASVMNMNGMIVSETRDGTQRFLSTDPLGSVVDVRNSMGTRTDSYVYWPFGEIRTSTGSSTNPWRFSGAWGYYFDGISYYVRAREYRSDLSRWWTVDALWPDQPQYAFAGATPLVTIDPSGLVPVIVEFHAFIGGWRGSWFPEYPPPIGSIANYEFKGDERDFGQAPTSRLYAWVTIDSWDIGRVPPEGGFNVGLSHRRKKGTLKPVFEKLGRLIVRRGPTRFVRGCASFFQFEIEGHYPFITSLPIVMEVNLRFSPIGGNYFNVGFHGVKTWFPDFEAYVKVPAYRYMAFLTTVVSPFAHPADWFTGGLVKRPLEPWKGNIWPPGPSRPCGEGIGEDI